MPLLAKQRTVALESEGEQLMSTLPHAFCACAFFLYAWGVEAHGFLPRRREGQLCVS